MLDYDGVLVDSLEIEKKAFIEACYENEFYEINSENFLSFLEVNFYEKMIEQHGLDLKKINNILNSYKALLANHLAKFKLFDGIDEVFKAIKDDNAIYIITSNLESICREVLTRNHIKNYIDILGADKEKSKIKKILNTKSKYSDLPAIFISDTKGDILEGKETGVKTIGVTWGWHDKEKIQEADPDYIVDTPEELLSIFIR
jgi:phosphoglycolate phosphatase